MPVGSVRNPVPAGEDMAVLESTTIPPPQSFPGEAPHEAPPIPVPLVPPATPAVSSTSGESGDDPGVVGEEWDRSGTEQSPAAAEVLREMVNHHSLVDVWRDDHPDDVSTFTYVQVGTRRSCHSRLDSICMSRFHLLRVQSSIVRPAPFSDHRLVTVMASLRNITIISLVGTRCRLHTPMYCFLCNLSFLEIWYTTATIPKTLTNLMSQSKTISFLSCLLQMLSFCGPTVINHFFCDIDSWIELSCTDTRLFEMVYIIICFIVILGSCAVTLVSYIYIISTILRIPSAQGWKKTFSSCSAHLTVVVILYGSAIFLYVEPSKQNSLDMNKIVSVFNTIVTSLLNPFIYTLRNKEVEDILRKAFSRT
ncbi:olfactory receptor 6M1-like [Gopherus flavomarginatus]|uniref:olfactory receptor 6M1-like n=1 Tax=Gopherus flavomarginatus TaxID=286002 RepID=UPI0021CBC4F3|nr:olfactory receptor 6M1-like [Gopherus flavomarginatus]